jgi:hypothetical protein
MSRQLHHPILYQLEFRFYIFDGFVPCCPMRGGSGQAQLHIRRTFCTFGVDLISHESTVAGAAAGC